MTEIDATSIRQAFESAIGAEYVSDDVDGYAVDGVHPRLVVSPNSIEELSRVMATAADSKLAVTPWGGGTRIGLGNVASRVDVVVDIRNINQVVQHNYADLTATVQAGATITSVQGTLSEHSQFLAIDPPLPTRATIGGSLAVGASGPLKWQYGHPRDVVIGMKVVQADGKIVKSGGQVVKNVSGYDMARLYIGSIGTLGIIAEVSFKLTPLPKQEGSIVAVFDSNEKCIGAALDIFNSNIVPLALTTLDSEINRRAEIVDVSGDCLLVIRLGGRSRALERQMRECTSICRERGASSIQELDPSYAAATWRSIGDFGWDDATKPLISARAMVTPTTVSTLVDSLKQSGTGSGVSPAILTNPAFGNVALNWFFENGDEAGELADVLERARSAVHSAGGRMIIEHCPSDLKSALDIWDEVGESLPIMRRMKEQYDPDNILNPGRFVGGI